MKGYEFDIATIKEKNYVNVRFWSYNGFTQAELFKLKGEYLLWN